MSKTIVGQFGCGGEFIIGRYQFKRVGPFLNGRDVEIVLFGDIYKEPFYQINQLPYATGRGLETKPRLGHQNTIVAQELKTGAFYFIECHLSCKMVSSPGFAPGIPV